MYFVSQMSLRNWSSLLNFPNALDSGLKSGGGSSKSEVLLLSGVSCLLPGVFLRTEGPFVGHEVLKGRLADPKKTGV